jgi:transketolase
MSKKIATRKAFGEALVKAGHKYPEIMVLDAETGNSTFTEFFEKEFPERFIQCYIAEQNMVSVATGLGRSEKIPFLATFGAFLTRAHDQIRMAQYSDSNLKIVGSHAGVSIGQDGASQMALEDIAMMRSLLDTVVFYPSDEVSTHKLVDIMASTRGMFYLRTTRADTDVIYSPDEEFKIGGSKTVKSSQNDEITIVGAGITLFEALKAFKELKEQGIKARIIDLYCIKPIDIKTLMLALQETKAMIVVEDHFIEGGIYEAILSALHQKIDKTNLELLAKPIVSLAVKKEPMSGTPEELLEYEEIDAKAIIKKSKEVLSNF